MTKRIQTQLQDATLGYDVISAKAVIILLKTNTVISALY